MIWTSLSMMATGYPRVWLSNHSLISMAVWNAQLLCTFAVYHMLYPYRSGRPKPLRVRWAPTISRESITENAPALLQCHNYLQKTQRIKPFLQAGKSRKRVCRRLRSPRSFRLSYHLRKLSKGNGELPTNNISLQDRRDNLTHPHRGLLFGATFAIHLLSCSGVAHRRPKIGKEQYRNSTTTYVYERSRRARWSTTTLRYSDGKLLCCCRKLMS